MKTQAIIKHPKEILLLREKFVESGYQLFLVGGCVRDSIIGEKPKDWDLATDATPKQMMQFLKEFHIIPVGEAFGVIRIVFPDHEFEIATFREDIGHGRRPDSVRFTNIETDVLRRDFTINALFFDLETSHIVDLVGGIDDLQNNILRTVGLPKDRFSEDPLRKLRAVRFTTRFNMQMDEETELAIRENPSLKGVSPERIRDELLKSLKTSVDMEFVIHLIDHLGLRKEVFRDMSICHTMCLQSTDPITFIAAILRKNRLVDIENFLRRLTFTANEIRDIKFLIQMQQLDSNPYKMKRSQKTDVNLIHRFASITQMDSSVVTEFVNWELTVTGEELIAEGFRPGPGLGNEIERRENEIFNSLSRNVILY